jgi:hypothetical protein
MISKAQKISAILLPLVAVVGSQAPQSVSAREYKEKCGNYASTREVPTGRSNTETTRTMGGYPDGRDSTTSTRTVYETKTVDVTVNKCVAESAFGAVVNFGNGTPSYGLSIKIPLARDAAPQSAKAAIRGSYIFNDAKGNDLAGALTAEFDVGAVDLFIGGGYNFNNRAEASYYFATAGIDYRLTPSIDISGSIRVPISSVESSSSTNYFVGAAYNF